MNYNTELARQEQLDSLIPAQLKDGYNKRLLYVGGHLRYGRNLQMSAYFRKAGYVIDVIEIFPDNIAQLANIQWIKRLIEGDIRLFDPFMVYDVVVFWHGPEHLGKDEVPALLDRMKRYSNAIIFATPNGRFEQGPEYGNPAESHASIWYMEDFTRMDMVASAIGNPDEENGNIIAYWIREGGTDSAL